MAEKKVKFEDALEELEGIVQKLERDDVPLDEGFTLFEKGVKLSKMCSEKLNAYDRQVKIVRSGKSKAKEKDDGQTGKHSLELFDAEG